MNRGGSKVRFDLHNLDEDEPEDVARLGLDFDRKDSSVRFDLHTLDEDQPADYDDEDLAQLGLDFDRKDSSHNLGDGLFQREHSVRFRDETPPTLRRVPLSYGSLLGNDDDPSYHEELDFANLDLDFGLQTGLSLSQIWFMKVGMSAFLDFYATLIWYYKSSAGGSDSGYFNDSFHMWVLSNRDNFAFAFSFFWFVDAFVLASRQMSRVRTRLQRQRLLLREDEIQDKLYRSRAVFVVSLFLQLLLLPTGFYVFLFRLSTNEATREFLLDGVAVGVVKNTVQYYYSSVCIWVDEEWRGFVRRYLWRGLLRPFQLRREIRSILRMIRWARYLAPLSGTIGILFRHLCELMTLRRQRRLAWLGRKEREAFRSGLSEKELKEYCATQIQAVYRRREARKFRYAIALLRGDRKKLNFYTMQEKLRKSFCQGISIAAEKHERLRVLEEKSKAFGRKKKKLSQSELRDLYQLRQELQTQASDLLNKRLLLRPDSTFVILWRNFFVIAVLIEIIGQAIVPLLEQGRKRNDESISMNSLLKQVLVPTTMHKVCKIADEGRGWILLRIFKGSRSQHVCSAPTTLDEVWALLDRMSTSEVLLNLYRVLVIFLIDRGMAIVSFMLFLDVFVTFFTGDIQPETGLLVPRPFFQRYIFPGIIMELAVNPYMENTSRLIMAICSVVIRKDPVRVLRWTIALFYPLSKAAAPLIWRFWCYFTHNCNRHIDTKATDYFVQGRRSSSFVRALSKVYDAKHENPILGSPSTGNLLWF